MDEHMESQLERVHAVVKKIFLELKRVCEKYDIQYFLAYGSLLGAVRHKGIIPWDEDMDVWMTRDNYQKLYQHKNEFGEAFDLVGPEDFGPNKYWDSIPRLYYKYAHVNKNDELRKFYDNKISRLGIDIFLIDNTYSTFRGKMQMYELWLLYALTNAYRSKAFDLSERSSLHRAAQACLNVVGRLFPLNWLEKRTAKVAAKYDTRTDTDIVKVTTDSITGMKRSYPKAALEKSVYMPFEDTQASVPVGYDVILTTIYNDYMKLPPVEQQIPHMGEFIFQGSQLSADVFVFDEPEEKS